MADPHEALLVAQTTLNFLGESRAGLDERFAALMQVLEHTERIYQGRGANEFRARCQELFEAWRVQSQRLQDDYARCAAKVELLKKYAEG